MKYNLKLGSLETPLGTGFILGQPLAVLRGSCDLLVTFLLTQLLELASCSGLCVLSAAPLSLPCQLAN